MKQSVVQFDSERGRHFARCQDYDNEKHGQDDGSALNETMPALKSASSGTERAIKFINARGVA